MIAIIELIGSVAVCNVSELRGQHKRRRLADSCGQLRTARRRRHCVVHTIRLESARE